MPIKSAICVVYCSSGHKHGIVKISESKLGGVDFRIHIHGLPVGKHGFHVHRSGNISSGSAHLCDHFNPTNSIHGDINSRNSHAGDLGNISANSSEICDMEIHSAKLRLNGKNSIIGRSLVIHSQEDDLGRGGDEESLRTGNSGDRIMWGIIAIDESC